MISGSDNSNNRNTNEVYYILDEENVDPKRIKKEREKARKLKKSQWWLSQINRGICHYCTKKFRPSQLTMDHVVPIARGGQSTPGNTVPSCQECNRNKKLDTPVDEILKKLKAEGQLPAPNCRLFKAPKSSDSNHKD